jgi:hypothetical protein
MNRHESTAFLRSDEDDPDWLRDKPMGWCPSCGAYVFNVEDGSGHAWVRHGCNFWDCALSELENRARYQEERMAAAKIEERVNRELRGRDAPY